MIEVVGAVLVSDGRLLMGLRAAHKAVAPGAWDLIGGHVEPGETPLQALRREVFEELGVVVEAARSLELLSFVHQDAPGRLHLFQVTAWRGTPAIANDEHVDLRWFSGSELEAVTNLAFEAYREVFVRALAAS